jgi:hypothetical protein
MSLLGYAIAGVFYTEAESTGPPRGFLYVVLLYVRMYVCHTFLESSIYNSFLCSHFLLYPLYWYVDCT